MLPEDPEMLLSVVNTKLRDTYDNLESLCDDLDISESEIVEKLKKAGYVYHAETNQFKKE
jgi:biotin operon repressor